MLEEFGGMPPPHENFEVFKGKFFILSIFEEGRTS
jgi:hypothetical protein